MPFIRYHMPEKTGGNGAKGISQPVEDFYRTVWGKELVDLIRCAIEGGDAYRQDNFIYPFISYGDRRKRPADHEAQEAKNPEMYKFVRECRKGNRRDVPGGCVVYERGVSYG